MDFLNVVGDFICIGGVLLFSLKPKEEDKEAKKRRQGDTNIADTHRQAGCLGADFLMEGLQIPENGDSEYENSADVENHSHLGFAVAVKHAENGRVDCQRQYGQRVESMYGLNECNELLRALCHLILIIQGERTVWQNCAFLVQRKCQL